MGMRYQEVYRLEHKKYADGCPLIIEAAVLQKDNAKESILAQVKVRNIAIKTVIAYKVNIRAYELNGTEIDGVDQFPFLDICIPYGQEGGSRIPIYLPNSETRSFDVSISEIVFEDKSIWNGTDSQWINVPEQTKLSEAFDDNELVKQYSLEVGQNSIYYPERKQGLFFCTCGAIVIGDGPCYSCKRKAEDLLKALDYEELRKRIAARLENEHIQAIEQKKREERERIEREKKEELERLEAERAEKERIQQQQIANKRMKILAAAIGIVVLLGVAFRILVVPEFSYKNVENLYARGNYDEALELLKGENWFFTDQKKIVYMTALCRYGKGDYSAALDLLDTIGSYNDVASKKQEIIYAAGKKAYDEGQLEVAIEQLEPISGYQDSTSLIETAKKTLDEQKKAAELEAEIQANKEKNDDLYQQIQMEVFLSNYDEADKLITELPVDYISENPEVKGFIEALPNTYRDITGYWHSYGGKEKKEEKREDYGYYIGLLYVDGRFMYDMEHFLNGEGSFPDTAKAEGLDNLKLLADWKMNGDTLVCEDSLREETYVYDSKSEKLYKYDYVLSSSSTLVDYKAMGTEIKNIYVR